MKLCSYNKYYVWIYYLAGVLDDQHMACFCRWWMEWQQYVAFDHSDVNSSQSVFSIPCRPGEIDNSCLILNEASTQSNELDLKEGLQEGQDYILVPQEVWKKLLEW